MFSFSQGITRHEKYSNKSMDYIKAFYLSTLFAVFLVNSRLCLCELKGPTHSVENFFDFVDQDGDGEIEQYEVTQFMASFAAEDFSEDSTRSETTGDNFIPHSFNFSYGGNTISSEEMLDHLQNMLTADHVVEWIKHGLQLPQYEEAFKNNSVNGLDFPSLIENGSWTLATELGISSTLHCKRITYAIVRQIFGFGAPPGPSRNVKCNPLLRVGIQLHWNSPHFLGYPPLHKSVIFRREVLSSVWVPIAETKENHFLDHNVQADVVYLYRIQGWGGHGSSELVTVTRCNISTSAKPGSFASIDFHNPSMQAVSNAADNANSHSSNLVSSNGRRKHEPDVMIEASNFWAWMFSVNSGLLLLGILSRQSFLFRFSLAAWVLFKIHVLHQIHSTVLQAQSSKYGLLRALAHTLIFANACCAYIQAKIWFLSRQVTSFPSDLVTLSASDNEKKFLSQAGTFQDAIGYSVASCTLDEMLEATKKQQFSVRPIRSKDRIPQAADWVLAWDASDRTSSKMMSNEAFLAADKNSLDFAVGLGKGPMQKVDVRENSTCSKLADTVACITKRVKSSGTIHTNDEEFINGSSHVTGPLESRCLSAPASVDRFSLSASDSEYDRSADGEGYSKKSHDDTRKQKPWVALASTRRTRSRCNKEGCRVRFDRWHSLSDWQMVFSRHYCRECQGVFCVHHTRISPHGRHGQCGFDSNCYCSECFQALPKEVQKELESLNKLQANSMKKKCPSAVKLFSHDHNSKPEVYQSSSHSLDGRSLEIPGSSSSHTGNSGDRLNSTSTNSRNSDVQDQAGVFGHKIFPIRFSKSTMKASIQNSSSEHNSNVD